MRFRDDNRAVTVQIGAVMLFATIVIALSLYQATVVPSQNADVEYKHSQVVQGQLVDVRNALLSTAASGSTRPASVELGTGYPSRVFLMNPPPATGTLRTGAYANSTIRVSNVVATNDETEDYLDGSWSASTKYLLYQPDYHEFDGAPALLYEASVLSNHYPDANATIPLTDQLLVRGNTITLVTLNGTLSTTRAGSVSVSPNPLSAPYQRVQVEPETGDSVTVTVPTRIPADRFASRTGLGQNPNVTVTDAGQNRVRIEVSGYSTYTLQTARIGVGSDTVDPPAHYLTVVESDDDSVTVEARDRFNNAESGVMVNASDPGLFKPNSTRTGVNGRATFTVTSSGNWSSSLFILDNSSALERVNVNGDATSGGGNGGGDGTPAAPDINMRVDDLTHQNSNSPRFVVSYDLDNTNASFERVEVQFTDTDGSADGSLQSSTRRGSVNYQPGFGAGNSYDITLEVIYSGSSGEYVAAQRTFQNVLANAENPPDNDNLGSASSPSLSSGTAFEDKTKTNQNEVWYRADYTVSQTSSFDHVEFVAISRTSGGQMSDTSASQSQNNWDLRGTYGADTPFKVAMLVYDSDGVVVDVKIVVDTADGNGP